MRFELTMCLRKRFCRPFHSTTLAPRQFGQPFQRTQAPGRMPPYAYDYGSETDSTSYILLVRSRLMASIVGGLSVFFFTLFGSPGGTRTHTPMRGTGFKSVVSTNSTTGPFCSRGGIRTHNLRIQSPSRYHYATRLLNKDFRYTTRRNPQRYSIRAVGC